MLPLVATVGASFLFLCHRSVPNTRKLEVVDYSDQRTNAAHKPTRNSRSYGSEGFPSATAPPPIDMIEPGKTLISTRDIKDNSAWSEKRRRLSLARPMSIEIVGKSTTLIGYGFCPTSRNSVPVRLCGTSKSEPLRINSRKCGALFRSVLHFSGYTEAGIFGLT